MGLSACGVLSVLFAGLLTQDDGGPCTRLRGPCTSDPTGRALAPGMYVKCNILPAFNATAQADAAACAEQLEGRAGGWAPLRPTLAAFAHHGCEAGREQLISGLQALPPDGSLLDRLIRIELSGMNPLVEMQPRLQALLEERAISAAWRAVLHAPSFVLQRAGGEGDGMRVCVRPAATAADAVQRLRDAVRLVRVLPHPASQDHGKLPVSLMEVVHALPPGPAQWQLHCSAALELDPDVNPLASATVVVHALVHAFESGLLSAGFARRAGGEEAQSEVESLQSVLAKSASVIGRSLLAYRRGTFSSRLELAQRVADAFLAAHPLSGRAVALRAHITAAAHGGSRANASQTGPYEAAFESFAVHASLRATSVYARSIARLPDAAAREAVPLLAADPTDAPTLRALAANASDGALRAAVTDVAALTSLHSAVSLPGRRDAYARVVGPVWRHAARVLGATVRPGGDGDATRCLTLATRTLAWAPHPPSAVRAAGSVAADMVWLTLAAATAARIRTPAPEEQAGDVPPLASVVSALRRCVHPEGGVREPVEVVRACRAALLTPFARESVPLLGARAEKRVLSTLAACAWKQWADAADAFAGGGAARDLARAATGLAREVRTCVQAAVGLPTPVHPARATDAVAVVSRVRNRAYHRCASNSFTCPMGLLHPDASAERDSQTHEEPVTGPAVDKLQEGYEALWGFVRDNDALSPADDDNAVEILMRPRDR